MDSEASLDLRLQVKREDEQLPERAIKVPREARLSQVIGFVAETYPQESGFAEDYELYLLKEGHKSKLLDQKKVATDYSIVSQDVLQALRKTLPVCIYISITETDKRRIEVNGYLSVAEATSWVCKQLAIEHCEELSLAKPPESNAASRYLAAMWMKSTASLKSQGIKDGDTLLLRKKLFIENKDILEATEGNQMLLDLLYNQVAQMLSEDNAVPPSVNLGMVCSLLHHIEQGDMDISDKEVLKKVMPRRLKDNQKLHDQAVECYHNYKVGSLQKADAKCRLLKEMSQPGMTTGVFPINGPATEVLMINAWGLSVCSEEQGQLIPKKEWPLASIKDVVTQKDSCRVYIEEWHEFHTELSPHISHYLSDIQLATGNEASKPSVSSDEERAITIITQHQNGDIPPEPEVVMVLYPEGYHAIVTVEVEDTQPAAGTVEGETSVSRRKEVRIHERAQTYLGINCDKLLKCYKLFHFEIFGKDIRALLVNTTLPVEDIIYKICETFGIKDTEDLSLSFPKAMADVLEKYGGRPVSGFQKIKRLSLRRSHNFNRCLDPTTPLCDQYDFSIRPYILQLDKSSNAEDTDAPEGKLDELGEEWPDFENPTLALQREFHQCWCGVVQGDYPVSRQTAVKVAALLHGVYNGSFEENLDYSIEVFLPPFHCNSPGIAEEVKQECLQYQERNTMVVMEEVIQLCRSVLTYEGIFFDVEEVVTQRPWKKTKQRMLGINHQGVINVESKTGKILFVHRFSDISKWTAEDQLVHLSFGDWDVDYNAYTYQAEQIIEVLRLYIGMTTRGQIEQAPSHPRQ